MNSEKKIQENHRDRISTVDEKGKRRWIYPRKPTGPFYRARSLVSIFLLGILVAAPLIKINGQPFLLLNVVERKFIIFGIVFWPQDFHLFVLATITLIVFIVLFTVVYGRIFCGWVCPQTIFMEMLFRKIEYWIEGDARQQRELKARPLNFSKFLKKSSKQAIFYALSFIISNIFLAYFIGIGELKKIVTDPPSQHLVGLTAMIIFSAAFYYVFAFFREQVCTLVCPYGRLQGVLLDQNSIVVAYDFKRGEPRGKLSRKKAIRSFGDCINCLQCVHVCPTGIDIRDGTQLECINCTACIDACNQVMKKINKPKGLIRYTSFNGINLGQKLKLTPRIAGYSAVLLILVSIMLILVLNRAPVETTILRTPGVLYQELDNGMIANLYNIKVLNKTLQDMPLRLFLKSPPGQIDLVGEQLLIPKGSFAESAFFIKLSKAELKTTSTTVLIDIYSNNELVEQKKSTFLGPKPYLK